MKFLPFWETYGTCTNNIAEESVIEIENRLAALWKRFAVLRFCLPINPSTFSCGERGDATRYEQRNYTAIFHSNFVTLYKYLHIWEANHRKQKHIFDDFSTFTQSWKITTRKVSNPVVCREGILQFATKVLVKTKCFMVSTPLANPHQIRF